MSRKLTLWQCDDLTYDIVAPDENGEGEVIRQNVPEDVILASQELAAALRQMYSVFNDTFSECDSRYQALHAAYQALCKVRPKAGRS